MDAYISVYKNYKSVTEIIVMIKKLILISLAIIVLGIGTLYIVLMQTDQDQLKNKLITQLSEATGLDVNVEGETKLLFRWKPVVSISNLVAKSTLDAPGKPLLTIEHVYLEGRLIPFLLGDFEIQNIRLRSPVINVFKSETGAANLDALSSNNKNQTFDVFDNALITIENGNLNYVSINHFIDHTISEINITLEMDSIYGPYDLTGSIGGKKSDYAISMKSGNITNEGSTVSFTFQHQLFSLSFNGSFSSGNETFNSVNGNVEFSGNDIAEFTSHYFGRRKLFDHIPPNQNTFSISTSLNLTNDNLSLRDITFNSKESMMNDTKRNQKADSQYNESYIEAYIGDKKYLDINLNFDYINLDNIFYLSEIHSVSMIDIEIPDFTIMFDLQADEVYYNNQAAKNVHVGAQLIGRGLELYPITAEIPGQGVFSMSGTLTKPPIRSDSSIMLPVFNGEFMASGDDLIAVNQWIKFAPAVGTDTETVMPFKAEGKVKIQPHRIEVYDLSSIINKNSNIAGDAVLRHGAGRSKLSARFEIDNIDLDKLFDLSKGKGETQGFTSASEAIPLAIKIQRIARLPFNFDTELSFSSLVFNKKQFNNITAEMTVSANRIALDRIYIKAHDNDFNAHVALDLSNENPRLSTRIEGKKLNTSFFLTEQTREERIKELEKAFLAEQANEIIKTDKVLTIDRSIIWSTVPYDLSRLLLFNGTLDIELKELVHKGIEFDDLKINGNIKKNILHINNFTSRVFDGTLELFNMQITSIPSITTVFNFKMNNISFNTFMEQVLNKKDVMKGKVNVVGALGLSGNSTKSWISSMRGEYAMAASNLQVKGFNLENLIENLPSIQDENELVTLANKSLSGLNQDKYFAFNTVNSSGVINKGQVLVKKFEALSNRYNAATTGVIDIKNWLMKLQSSFIFAPSGRYIPYEYLKKEKGVKFGMRFSGDLDKPKVQSSIRKIQQYFRAAKKEEIRIKNEAKL